MLNQSGSAKGLAKG